MKVIQLHKNETKLIQRAAKQNREAQHVLYEVHSPKMLSVCRYYIKDVHQAEEVMLNGFFKVFKYLKTFKNEGSFEGWIRRIMVNECIDFIRVKKNVFQHQDIENVILSEAEDSEEMEDFSELLLDKRNSNWVPKMQEVMGKETCFFAVGAGHLGGKNLAEREL